VGAVGHALMARKITGKAEYTMALICSSTSLSQACKIAQWKQMVRRGEGFVIRRRSARG
jgi:hypothetical protein